MDSCVYVCQSISIKCVADMLVNHTNYMRRTELGLCLLMKSSYAYIHAHTYIEFMNGFVSFSLFQHFGLYLCTLCSGNSAPFHQ